MRWFWIDRYTEFVCRKRATAVKNISLAEEHLQDHFDGAPIMPGSLIIEGIAQTGGLLVSEVTGFERPVVLGKISKSVFHCPAYPGDTLTYRVQVENLRENGASISATSHIGDRLQGEAEMFFANLEEGNNAGVNGQIFPPNDLLTWLSILGVFTIGQHADGSPLRTADYPFAVKNGW